MFLSNTFPPFYWLKINLASPTVCLDVPNVSSFSFFSNSSHAKLVPYLVEVATVSFR